MIIRDEKPAAPPSETGLKVQKMIEALNAREAAKTAPVRRLEELEGIIQTERDLGRKHNAAYIEAGKALKEVRDSKLYKENYGTFEEYCERRWKFKADYARKLIGASTSALELPEPKRPKTERESRKSFKNRQKIDTMVSSKMHDVPQTPKREFAKTDKELATEVWKKLMARLEAQRYNPGFVKALDEWLTESGF